MLQNYGKGSIIVMAETIEEAREKVRKAAIPYLIDAGRIYWPEGSEEDKEQQDEYLAKLEKDLTEVPMEDEIIFISGSD